MDVTTNTLDENGKRKMVTTLILHLTFAFTIVYRMGYFTQYHLSNLNWLSSICQDIFPFGPRQYSCLFFLGFPALDWWSVETYVSCTDGTVCDDHFDGN